MIVFKSKRYPLKTKIFYVCFSFKLNFLHLSPSVAVVILNWNGRNFLEKFLPSVLASTYHNASIIVVDNASTDDSVQWLQNNFPQVRIIIHDNNEGFAQGYNLALRQITSDYYVLLNSDVEVDKNWIEPVINLLENDKNIAACQPKILSYHDRTSFEYAGAAGGWIDHWGYPFTRGRVFNHCERDHGQYDDARSVFWATGASLFVRATAFHEAGGFDPYFFAHQEEIDLCWRLQRNGYRVYVQPLSKVYHVGAGTLAAESPQKTFLNFRNNLVMLAKNLPAGEAINTICWRLVLDWVAALQILLAGKIGSAWAIIKAHVAFIKWTINTKNNSSSKKISWRKLQGVYRGCIVWQFFVKKKNTFSEIVDVKN